MSKRRRKKKHDDGHMDESWLLPYSDLVTLLFALFLVLFASSTENSEKMQQMSNTFNAIFSNSSGILEHPRPTPDSQLPAVIDGETGAKGEEEEKKEQDKKTLEQIQINMNHYITQGGLEGSVETTLTDEGLLVRITSEVLFNSGKADLHEEQQIIARNIAANLVSNPPVEIVVSGHTDNMPIKNAEYSSNWDLSFARAVTFMSVILEDKQLDPKFFSAKGYGEFNPIAPNDTPEGRAQNRRVEVLISPTKQP